jgi:hypothetical protein
MELGALLPPAFELKWRTKMSSMDQQLEPKECAAASASQLDLARQRLNEHSQKLTEWQHKRASLELERTRLSVAAATDDLPRTSGLDREIAVVCGEIQMRTDAISHVKKIIAKLEHKDVVRNTLEVVDRLAATLVEISTEIGLHMSAVPALMERGEQTAAELDQLILECLPEGSHLRSGWGTGAQTIFRSSGAMDNESRLRALKESATLGDFVKSRLASLRGVIESELKKSP